MLNNLFYEERSTQENDILACWKTFPMNIKMWGSSLLVSSSRSASFNTHRIMVMSDPNPWYYLLYLCFIYTILSIRKKYFTLLSLSFLCQNLPPLFKLLPSPFLPITGVDTGCFRHQYTNFGHTNLGMPKFNLK